MPGTRLTSLSTETSSTDSMRAASETLTPRPSQYERGMTKEESSQDDDMPISANSSRSTTRSQGFGGQDVSGVRSDGLDMQNTIPPTQMPVQGLFGTNSHGMRSDRLDFQTTILPTELPASLHGIFTASSQTAQSDSQSQSPSSYLSGPNPLPPRAAIATIASMNDNSSTRSVSLPAAFHRGPGPCIYGAGKHNGTSECICEYPFGLCLPAVCF